MKRKIIKIDEDKCNGCGECLPNCKEGALRMVSGKVKLVSESACDGLGACLGHCPQDAISIEERESAPFQEDPGVEHTGGQGGACPGARMMSFKNQSKDSVPAGARTSAISNWPVQLKLVPVNAPYLNGSDLLISSDCVPFAYPDFHRDLLKDKILLVACPKLDDLNFYREKLSQLFKANMIKSVTYAYMEVPCCLGLLGIIQEAIDDSGKAVPFSKVMIGIKGEVIK
jgi:NAD-dependent dihydropyrimidine dehydrogenase PreA subunit